MAKTKKSWTEKLHASHGLPKVVKMTTKEEECVELSTFCRQLKLDDPARNDVENCYKKAKKQSLDSSSIL